MKQRLLVLVSAAMLAPPPSYAADESQVQMQEHMKEMQEGMRLMRGMGGGMMQGMTSGGGMMGGMPKDGASKPGMRSPEAMERRMDMMQVMMEQMMQHERAERQGQGK